MRDMVEIGMGRTARRTYELADINIVPSRRTRSSQDVTTAWQLDAYRFEIPIVAHPTDALVSPEFAIELGRLGGLAVLNGEGLWSRYEGMRAGMVRNPISHNPVDYRIREGFWAALPDAGRYPKSRIRLTLLLVGARGFEPPTSRSRTVRSSQAELRPVTHDREEF